jgi:hypothetical protein
MPRPPAGRHRDRESCEPFGLLVAAALREAGGPGHLREADRRSARDEAALAAPGWPPRDNPRPHVTKVLTAGTSGANADRMLEGCSAY